MPGQRSSGLISMNISGGHADIDGRPSDERRGGAYLVDQAMIAIAITAVNLVAAWLGFVRPEVVGGWLDAAALIWDLPYVVVPAIYFIGFWTSTGRTIGMRLCGLRVVRADDLGQLAWRTALIRWLALEGVVRMASWLLDPSGTYFFAMLIVALTWMAILWLSTRQDPMARGLHDRVSGSRVMGHPEAAAPAVY